MQRLLSLPTPQPKLRRHLLVVMLLPVLLLSVTGAMLAKPATVFAANDPSGACRAIFAAAQRPPVATSKIKADHPFIQSCIKKGYPAGYKNPNNNDSSAACPGTDAHITFCQAGFKKGQADAKGASGTAAPSTATIKKDAEKACKPYQDQKGASSKDKKDNFAACVTGYTGQLTGKDRGTACRSYSGGKLSSCIKGHDAAINKKPIVPGTASTPGTPASPTAPGGGTSGGGSTSGGGGNTGKAGTTADPVYCAAYKDKNPNKPLPEGCTSNASAICDQNKCNLVQKYVGPMLNMLSIIFGLVVALSLIIGGVQYTASAGDSQKVAAAKRRIQLTIVAFMAYAFLYAFLQFLVPGGIFKR